MTLRAGMNLLLVRKGWYHRRAKGERGRETGTSSTRDGLDYHCLPGLEVVVEVVEEGKRLRLRWTVVIFVRSHSQPT
jgi:hypothetical protein